MTLKVIDVVLSVTDVEQLFLAFLSPVAIIDNPNSPPPRLNKTASPTFVLSHLITFYDHVKGNQSQPIIAYVFPLPLALKQNHY